MRDDRTRLLLGIGMRLGVGRRQRIQDTAAVAQSGPAISSSMCRNERLISMVQQLRAAALRFELQFLAERPSAAESARQHAAILDATVHGAVGKAARWLEDNWRRGLRHGEQGVLS